MGQYAPLRNPSTSAIVRAPGVVDVLEDEENEEEIDLTKNVQEHTNGLSDKTMEKSEDGRESGRCRP